MLQSYFKKFSKQPIKKSLNALELPFMQYSGEKKVGIDVYKTSAIVHRCVSLIACSASHVPWQVYREKGGKREQISLHPVARLLKNPAPNVSGADFFTASISSLLLYVSLSIKKDHFFAFKRGQCCKIFLVHNFPTFYIFRLFFKIRDIF